MKIKIIAVVILALSTLMIVRSLALAHENTLANIPVEALDQTVQLKFEPAGSQISEAENPAQPDTGYDVCSGKMQSAAALTPQSRPTVDDGLYSKGYNW